MQVGRDHSLQETEGQGRRSLVRLTWSVRSRSRAVFSSGLGVLVYGPSSVGCILHVPMCYSNEVIFDIDIWFAGSSGY